MPQHRIFLQAERWFDRGRAASLGEIPCRRGCHRCCIGPFPITILDAKVLREGMVELDRAAQEDIEQRAKDQAAAIAQEFPQLGRSIYLDAWRESDVDRMAVRFAEFPCPALDPDGSCRLYRFRPLTCRLMGLPTKRATWSTSHVRYRPQFRSSRSTECFAKKRTVWRRRRRQR